MKRFLHLSDNSWKLCSPKPLFNYTVHIYIRFAVSFHYYVRDFTKAAYLRGDDSDKYYDSRPRGLSPERGSSFYDDRERGILGRGSDRLSHGSSYGYGLDDFERRHPPVPHSSRRYDSGEEHVFIDFCMDVRTYVCIYITTVGANETWRSVLSKHGFVLFAYGKKKQNETKRNL